MQKPLLHIKGVSDDTAPQLRAAEHRTSVVNTPCGEKEPFAHLTGQLLQDLLHVFHLPR